MSTVPIQIFQNGVSANGNGTAIQTDGIDSAIQVEIVESAGGTATVTFEGSFDAATNWYAVGYQQVNGVASPTRAATGISVTANSAKVYQILDPYPQLRARVSAVASSPTVTVRCYLVP